MTETGFGRGGYARTLAETPSAPAIEVETSVSIAATPGADSNPSYTEYAIYNETDGVFIDAFGNGSATAGWHSKAAWYTSTASGLTPSTLYTFKAKARNQDAVETGLGEGASITTYELSSQEVPVSLTVQKASSTVSAPGFMSSLSPSIRLGGKDLNEFGNKDAYDVPFGSGVANVHDILAELTLQNYRGYLSIEHENQKELDNPSPSIRKGLDYIKSITYYLGYEQILACDDNGQFEKHGWNHYGPGYFELDRKTGILKSHEGMGLFWYSAKKYKDFILELDYKTEVPNANSGVFYRVPDFVTSNEYIYKSFEIQIDDSQTGIHQTGSVYDAEAPKSAAWNKTGEWNHFKITCVGRNVKVELNGKLVIDWNMEPRGKIREYSLDGYIGLQNHDYATSVYFKDIFVKELK